MGRQRWLLLILLAGVCLMMGCGQKKYKVLSQDTVFKPDKKSYAAGETVTVYYDLFATDTDYSFFCDSDVDMKQSYDDAHGYVFTFTMPAHDVTMRVKTRNSMEYDPEAHLPDEPPADLASQLDPSRLAFRYLEKTVATQGGDRFTDYSLYRRDDGEEMILAVTYGDGDDETTSCCLVPPDVPETCLSLVKKHKMTEWKDGHGPRGMEYSVVFADESGEPVSVSSDHMPEKGQKAFDAIEEVLTEAWARYSSDRWLCPECGAQNRDAYCSECGCKKPE